MPKRAKRSESTTRKLVSFYGAGPPSVIDGSIENVELHHLDDDPTNSTFENLIPIGAELNSPVLSQANSNPTGISLAQATPEYLLLIARTHFLRWRTAQAYGCARLAYEVGSRYRPQTLFTRVELACQALYYARHAISEDHSLIFDVLRRNVLPLTLEIRKSRAATARSSPETGLILQEIAGIFGDAGLAQLATALYERIHPTANTFPSDAQKAASLLRREATSLQAQVGNDKRADELLIEASNLSPAINTQVSIANSRAWGFIQNENYIDALNVTEHIYKQARHQMFRRELIRAIEMTAWNAAELFHNYAIAARHCRSNNAMAATKDSAILFNTYHCRPFLLQEDFWKNERAFETGRGIDRIPEREILPIQVRKLAKRIVTELTM